MKYKKPFISFDEQIEILKSRGLIIVNNDFAIEKLSTVSYYRLRAYTYPFQDNTSAEHPFLEKITIENIFLLYDFDSNFRNLIFKALEKVEIALRTQIIYPFSREYGSHWQLEPNIYRDTSRFAIQITSLNNEISRSDETFIKHYFNKYSSPTQPPSWMSIEVASFGLLSKIYQNLKNSPEKLEVAKSFGLKKVDVLENWMFCFSNLRNICAHHGRLWNRRLTAKPTLPYNTIYPFLSKEEISTIFPNKIYATICCLYYMLKQIDEKNIFKRELITILETCELIEEKEMGFPKNWQNQTLWR